ncbi:MAG: creatininase family protein [Rhodobacterales bacterium]|nr:creatininase family protein [Rhodobacterales bacterium]
MELKSRFWADYSAREFAAMDRASLIAVLPIGATEQHGPHLPVRVDQAILDGVIRHTVPMIPAGVPALFLPTIPVGKSNEHTKYPGTLTFSAQTLMAMYIELGDSVARAGVRKLLILNSHGGQVAVMEIVARDLRIRHDMVVVTAGCGLGSPPGVISDHESRFGIHGGDAETSIMLALHPDLVAMDHARDFRSRAEDFAQGNRHLGLTPTARIAWQAQDMNAAGVCGNASIATLGKGEALLAHSARELVALLQEMDQLPLSYVDTKADPNASA